MRRKKTNQPNSYLAVMQSLSHRVGGTICLRVHPVPAHKPAATQIWKILFPAVSPLVWTRGLGIRDCAWEFMIHQPPTQLLACTRCSIITEMQHLVNICSYMKTPASAPRSHLYPSLFLLLISPRPWPYHFLPPALPLLRSALFNTMAIVTCGHQTLEMWLVWTGMFCKCQIHTGFHRVQKKNVNYLIGNFYIDCMLKWSYFGYIASN